MEKCPYCAEEIQDAAIKCKHCGEFLHRPARVTLDEDRPKWYFKTSFIVIAVLSIGPLALPFIWWRPNTSRAWKIGLTVAILALSWVLYRITVASMESIIEYYKMLNSL